MKQATIAVIPARGGSKRIPGKNIRPFHGKPIIAYAIEVANKSGLFDAVLVSTDDNDIAEIAQDAGAWVPFRRPAELADDFTPTAPVLLHALDWYESEKSTVEALCCIYPTAPFVTAKDLRQGHAALQNSPAAFSVTTYPAPVQWALERSEYGRVSMQQQEFALVRSQDLKEMWYDAGLFYWSTSEFLRNGANYMGGEAIGIPMPRTRVQDIDTEEDWAYAEAMFAALNALKADR